MMRLFSILVALAGPLAAADITGQWSIDGTMNGNPVSFDCAFRQNEKKLTGSCKAYQFSAEATGSVEEDTVRFTFVYDFGGTPYACTYSGKLTGPGEVRGTISITGIEGSTGEFVAKKS